MIGKIELLKAGYESKINMDLLWFLTCFHGLKSTLDNSNSKREECNSFLFRLGWTKEDILFGYDCLNRDLSEPLTIEEQIVHDAN